jgi:hypothetical protein
MQGYHRLLRPSAAKQLERERAARTMKIPAWSQRLLDRDGKVRGLTWRDMPGGNPVCRACNWWLWKHQMLNLATAKAEAAAIADISTLEENDEL